MSLNSNAPKIGKTYQVNHKFKGKFKLHISAVSGFMATGTIVKPSKKLKQDGYDVHRTLRIDLTLATLKEETAPVKKKRIVAKKKTAAKKGAALK